MIIYPNIISKMDTRQPLLLEIPILIVDRCRGLNTLLLMWEIKLTKLSEYLTMFVLLLEFVDPELAAHLDSLDFHPQLYAIPWFLTCFAHVLPLHKLFHLWDSLLLADATFPLFIGIAVLIELRPQLIHAQFNDAILLFSDLPGISIIPDL